MALVNILDVQTGDEDYDGTFQTTIPGGWVT